MNSVCSNYTNDSLHSACYDRDPQSPTAAPRDFQRQASPTWENGGENQHDSLQDVPNWSRRFSTQVGTSNQTIGGMANEGQQISASQRPKQADERRYSVQQMGGDFEPNCLVTKNELGKNGVKTVGQRGWLTQKGSLIVGCRMWIVSSFSTYMCCKAASNVWQVDHKCSKRSNALTPVV